MPQNELLGICPECGYEGLLNTPHRSYFKWERKNQCPDCGHIDWAERFATEGSPNGEESE